MPSTNSLASTTSFTQNTGWSVPQIIPGYDKWAWPPILVADQNHQVHAFSSQWVGNGDGTSFSSLVYNKWTLRDGWTEPIDIILSPSGEARLTSAYLDSDGMVHIVFWGGDSTAANIYYSVSKLETVDQVLSWSVPVPIAAGAGDPAGAILIENVEGELLLIYHGNLFGNGVFVIKSTDRGKTWSKPNSIFQTDSNAPLAWNIQAIRTKNGWLHVVWNVLTEGGQGRGIYYSRTENGKEWTEPILLDFAQEGYGTQTPAIIEYNDELITFFAGIYMRRSSDNGKTWSEAGRIFFRHTGVNGSLSPIMDGNGVLHLFFGQRITGSPDIHGMWHSTFKNDRWLEPEAIIKGPSIDDRIGEKSFDPFEARAVISQGNVLLVTWRTDPGLRGNGVWYSYKILDIPGLPISTSTLASSEVLSTPTSVDYINQVESRVTEVPIESAPPLFNKSRNPTYNFGYLIFVGVLPVIIIIMILVISRFRYTNRP